MLQWLLLPDTCYQVMFEKLLGNPKCQSATDYLRTAEHWGDKCSFCQGTTKLMPFVDKDGTIEVFFDLLGIGDRWITEPATLSVLVESMKVYPLINFNLFQSKAKTIETQKLKQVILMLVAARILLPSFNTSGRDPTKEIVFRLASSGLGKIALKNDTCWSRIPTLKPQSSTTCKWATIGNHSLLHPRSSQADSIIPSWQFHHRCHEAACVTSSASSPSVSVLEAGLLVVFWLQVFHCPHAWLAADMPC